MPPNGSIQIYGGMNEIFDKLIGETNVIRLVYGIGEMNKDWIEKETTTTHEIGNFPIMVKLGHFLDYGEAGKKSGIICYDVGLYKV